MYGHERIVLVNYMETPRSCHVSCLNTVGAHDSGWWRQRNV